MAPTFPNRCHLCELEIDPHAGNAQQAMGDDEGGGVASIAPGSTQKRYHPGQVNQTVSDEVIARLKGDVPATHDGPTPGLHVLLPDNLNTNTRQTPSPLAPPMILVALQD